MLSPNFKLYRSSVMSVTERLGRSACYAHSQYANANGRMVRDEIIELLNAIDSARPYVEQLLKKGGDVVN